VIPDRTKHDPEQMLLLLGICENLFTRASPATRRELDTLLRQRGITGGPGWLIDMLALTRLRLQHQHAGQPDRDMNKAASFDV
jgi:hypothetical protein